MRIELPIGCGYAIVYDSEISRLPYLYDRALLWAWQRDDAGTSDTPPKMDPEVDMMLEGWRRT